MTANFPCPNCGGASDVVATNKTILTPGVRRRRQCRLCKLRWTTYEHHSDLIKKASEVIKGTKNLKDANDHLNRVFRR